MLAICSALFCLVWLFLKETHVPEPDALRMTGIMKAYISELRTRVFMANVLAVGFVITALILYYTGGPFIYRKQLGLSAGLYGWWFMVSCLGYIAGTIVVRPLLRRYHPYCLMLLGTGLAFGGGILAMILANILPITVGTIVLPIILFTLGLAWISHPPLGGWIFECDLEYFFLSGALAVEPRPVDGWS